MTRRAAIVSMVALLGFLVIVTTAKAALFVLGDRPAGDGHRRVVGKGQIAFDGHGGEWWASRWRREHRTVISLRHRLRHVASRRLQTATVGPADAIRLVFGPYAAQALSVAGCESGLSTGASNGQYHGLFQMGESERRIYGDGSSALAQAQAAYRYFVASGRDWSPWTCKP